MHSKYCLVLKGRMLESSRLWLTFLEGWSCSFHYVIDLSENMCLCLQVNDQGNNERFSDFMNDLLTKEHVWMIIVMGLLNVLDEGKEYLAIWDLRMCACTTQLALARLFQRVSKQHLTNFLSLLYKVSGESTFLSWVLFIF